MNGTDKKEQVYWARIRNEMLLCKPIKQIDGSLLRENKKYLFYTYSHCEILMDRKTGERIKIFEIKKY